MIVVRKLESGYWHIRGYGPCNYAQPRHWPCDETQLRQSAHPEAGEEFIRDALREADASPKGAAMTPKERRRCLAVADGLKMALTFVPRDLLDTAVRESIKELRAIAAEPADPIRAAVDDVLDPVRDAVVQFGQKLAKGDHAWTPDATGTACAACGGSPSEHDGGEVVVACDCGNRDTITLPLTAMPPCSGGCGRRMRIVGIYREVMA